MTQTISHRQRLETCLSGALPDRLPVALWRHFPVADQNPANLARMTLEFQQSYDFDLIKVSPASSYCLVDYGSRDEWKGNPEGVREYTHQVVQQPEDWHKLPRLNPQDGSLGDVLKALAWIRDGNTTGAPILLTIFNPLAQAKNLAGKERLLFQMRAFPDEVQAGLEIITANTMAYIEEAKKLGIDGIFYAVQHAQYALLSVEEFRTFSRPFDLKILQDTSGLWLNMLHLHGDHVMFDQVSDYPVQIMNWHDRESEVDLASGLHQFPGIACGGLSRTDTMLLGTPEEVAAQVRSAAEMTAKRRYIVGTGCVLMTTTPPINIEAACQAAREIRR